MVVVSGVGLSARAVIHVTGGGRPNPFWRLRRASRRVRAGRRWTQVSELELWQRSLGFAALGFLTLVPLLIVVSAADPASGRGSRLFPVSVTPSGPSCGPWRPGRHTDEAASRRLGVSLRTYRRRVAALMAALGARSRFQAGLRAREILGRRSDA